MRDVTIPHAGVGGSIGRMSGALLRGRGAYVQLCNPARHMQHGVRARREVLSAFKLCIRADSDYA